MKLTQSEIKKTFRGHVFKNNQFIGQAHWINGAAYLLNVECGEVVSSQRHAAQDFRKIGKNEDSFNSVQNWELI